MKNAEKTWQIALCLINDKKNLNSEKNPPTVET